MTSVNCDYVRVIRTPALAAWLAYSDTDQRWHAEVFARSSHQGIQYLEIEYAADQPSERQLLRDAFHFGFPSPRPCRMEYRFDPSMTHGVLAMLRHWCQSRSADLDALLRAAYANEPERLDENVDDIVAQAEWEGIEYPNAANPYYSQRLLLALRDVGYNKIAAAFVPLIRQYG